MKKYLETLDNGGTFHSVKKVTVEQEVLPTPKSRFLERHAVEFDMTLQENFIVHDKDNPALIHSKHSNKDDANTALKKLPFASAQNAEVSSKDEHTRKQIDRVNQVFSMNKVSTHSNMKDWKEGLKKQHGEGAKIELKKADDQHVHYVATHPKTGKKIGEIMHIEGTIPHGIVYKGDVKESTEIVDVKPQVVEAKTAAKEFDQMLDKDETPGALKDIDFKKNLDLFIPKIARKPAGTPGPSRMSERLIRHLEGKSLNEDKDSDKLEYINSHREALGHPKFKSLSKEEIKKHERLINKHAPYGNDPWAGSKNESVDLIESSKDYQEAAALAKEFSAYADSLKKGDDKYGLAHYRAFKAHFKAYDLAHTDPKHKDHLKIADQHLTKSQEALGEMADQAYKSGLQKSVNTLNEHLKRHGLEHTLTHTNVNKTLKSLGHSAQITHHEGMHDIRKVTDNNKAAPSAAELIVRHMSLHGKTNEEVDEVYSLPKLGVPGNLPKRSTPGSGFSGKRKSRIIDEPKDDEPDPEPTNPKSKAIAAALNRVLGNAQKKKDK